MTIRLANGCPMTLTREQEQHPEFKRGLGMAQRKETPTVASRFTDAAWIGYWAGLGNHVNRTASQVNYALAI